MKKFIIISCFLFLSILGGFGQIRVPVSRTEQSNKEQKENETTKRASWLERHAIWTYDLRKIKENKTGDTLNSLDSLVPSNNKDALKENNYNCDSLLRRTKEKDKYLIAIRTVYKDEELRHLNNSHLVILSYNDDTPKGNDYDCDSLSQRVKEQVEFLNAYRTACGNDELKRLIKSPLEKVYDSTRIKCHKLLIEELYKVNKDDGVKRVYIVFFPLLEHYGELNNEIKLMIASVINSFDATKGFPSIELQKDVFYQSLNSSKYYTQYRYNTNVHQEIKYLEDVINDTKALFDDPSKFTKENFEKQLKKL